MVTLIHPLGLNVCLFIPRQIEGVTRKLQHKEILRKCSDVFVSRMGQNTWSPNYTEGFRSDEKAPLCLE